MLQWKGKKALNSYDFHDNFVANKKIKIKIWNISKIDGLKILMI
jgi:hypothetical protein